MAHHHDPFTPHSELPGNSADQPAPKTEPEPLTAPKGTSAEILGWVAGDKEKAQLALDSENSSGKPRKGLVDELKSLLEQ